MLGGEGAQRLRFGRRDAMRLAAGSAVVVAGSATLAACGMTVPSAVQTTGVATINLKAAKPTNAKSMVSARNGAYSLVATGTGPQGTADEFSYYFGTSNAANATWSCKVRTQATVSGDGSKSKAGLMVRASGDPAAAFATVVITDGNGAKFYWRPKDGAAVEAWPIDIALGVKAPIWLQIEKKGDKFTVAYSQKGKTWHNHTGNQRVTFTKPEYLVGLLGSANGNGSGVDVFSHVTGFKPTTFVEVSKASASPKKSTGKSSSKKG